MVSRVVSPSITGPPLLSRHAGQEVEYLTDTLK